MSEIAPNNLKMKAPKLRDIIGRIPYRLALAGGWIDQPFVSKFNPEPPGSMVVVSIEPTFRFMDRCGMATSTRKVAMNYWGDALPDGDPAQIVRDLYARENVNNPAPSGSQDMAGLVYPGVNRLDYDANIEGGYFPCHVESNNDPQIARWIEDIFYIIPVNQRPSGYDPLGIKQISPQWAERLGQSGKDCFDAILNRDINRLGASMNECMLCWHELLPNTLEHPLIDIDLLGILQSYQSEYPGAMYSGCGGGYLYIVSEKPVPGTFKIRVRSANHRI